MTKIEQHHRLRPQETSENWRDLGRESDPERGVGVGRGVKTRKMAHVAPNLAPNAPEFKKDVF